MTRAESLTGGRTGRGQEATILGGMFLLGVASRTAALPASLWEWDEFGFARALHDYDLAAHSPHPPGFPVFIALARMARLVLGDDHAALVAVSCIFSSFLGVVLYLFYREVLVDRWTAITGAVLSCLVPAIVVWGGTGRSDGPALVTGLVVLWLALRGRRSDRALLGAALLLGLGAGIRVTILPFTGVVLSLVLGGRLRRKEWGLVGGSVALLITGWLLWYLPLVLETGWNEYNQIMQAQSAFISEHDTVWSAQWTPSERLSAFLVRVWGEWWIALIFNGGAVLGLVTLAWRHRRSPLSSPLLWMFASFAPVLVFTLLINSPTAAVVYSLPFIPFFTGLTAAAIMGLPARTGLGVAAALVIGLTVWSLPVAATLRREPSPPVRAAGYLRRRFDPARDKIYHDELLTQHAIYYFRNGGRSEIERFLPDEDLSLNLIYPENRDLRHTYILSTAPLPGLSSQRFHWPAGVGLERLTPLSFGRYLDIHLSDPDPLRNIAWGAGWFENESLGGRNWRWMGREGRTGLFNQADQMRLRISGELPPQGGPLLIRLDGREIGLLRERQVDFSLPVDVASDATWSILTLEAARTFVPSRNGEGSDERELGFKCFSIEWEMIEGGRRRKYEATSFLREGWSPLRIGQPRSWRTTAPVARVALPTIPTETGRLRMIFLAPQPDTTISPSVEGRRLETFSPRAGEILTRDWVIDTRICPERQCLLTFESTGGGNPPGFDVTSLGWHPR